MANPRLEKRSEVFIDDNGNHTDKRCWFLFVGDDDYTTNALTVSISVNIFDEPRVTMTPVVTVRVANLISEISAEVS
jgi:hypothetical protein